MPECTVRNTHTEKQDNHVETNQVSQKRVSFHFMPPPPKKKQHVPCTAVNLFLTTRQDISEEKIFHLYVSYSLFYTNVIIRRYVICFSINEIIYRARVRNPKCTWICQFPKQKSLANPIMFSQRLSVFRWHAEALQVFIFNLMHL